MKIEGLGAFGISVNDQPLDRAINVFEQVQVQSGYGLSFPVMRIVLRDQHNYFVGPLALVDGTKITVGFGQDPKSVKNYEFLVFSTNISHDNQPGSIFTVYAVLNAPSLLFSAEFFKHQGTSTEALKALFEKHNFKYEAIHDARDPQLWVGCGESPLSLLQKITTHAYSGDKSCFTTAIDFDAAYTIDIDKQLQKEAQLDVYYDAPVNPDKPYIVTTEIKPESRSSLFNSMSNYGQTHYQHSMGGDELKFDKISPSVINSLPINADIKGELEMAAMTYGSGFDSGHGEGMKSNCHDNYYKARYQNLRVLGLMNQCVKFSNRAFINLPLFAIVNVNHGAVLNAGVEADSSIAGKYLIVGKTITLVGTQFLEVYELARFFITETGNTNTVSSANSSSPIQPETDLNNPGSQAKPATNLTATGNKPKSMGSSVLDKADAINTQANPNIPQGFDQEKSVFDELVDEVNRIEEDVSKSFLEKGESWAFPELVNKYGATADKLEALVGEVSSAIEKLDACKQLSKLEGLSVNIAMNAGDQLVKALRDREGQLNTALGKAASKINGVLESGEIGSSNLDLATVSANCKQRSEALKTAAVSDKVQDACLQNRDIDKLNVPVLNMVRKLSQVVDDIQNMLCALGDDNADS